MSGIISLSEWHPSLFAKWESNGRRLYTPLSSRKGYTVHHTAGGDGSQEDQYARGIADWHFSKWSRPGGYNFLIGELGTIFEMCGWEYIGAHAPGCNTNSIGVSFQGTFDSKMPNEDQLNSFAWLLNKHGVPKNQQGHRDCSSTGCPGNTLYKALPLPLGESTSSPKKTPKKTTSDTTWTETLVKNLPTRKKRTNLGSASVWDRRVQGLLVANGAAPRNTIRSDGTVDGKFGPGTHDAVSRFQKSSGIGVDGIVGPKTWSALLGR